MNERFANRSRLALCVLLLSAIHVCRADDLKAILGRTGKQVAQFLEQFSEEVYGTGTTAAAYQAWKSGISGSLHV